MLGKSYKLQKDMKWQQTVSVWCICANFLEITYLYEGFDSVQI